MASKTANPDGATPRAKASRRRFDVVPGGAMKSTSIDPREERLFQSLDVDNRRGVLRRDLEQTLAEAELRTDDRRQRESMAALVECEEAVGQSSGQPGHRRRPPQTVVANAKPQDG